MVLSSLLGYVTGYATKFVDKIVSKFSDKAASGITSGKKGMPEAVAKSAAPEKFNPATGEQLSSGRESGEQYGPKSGYADKTYEGKHYDKAAALLVPLVIGVAWLAYVFLIGRSDIPAAQLSPYSLSKQLFLLSTFMIVYVIFLILFCAGKRKAKKNIKKVKK